MQEVVRRRTGLVGWFADRGVGVKIGTAIGVSLTFLLGQGVNDLVHLSALAGRTTALYQQDAKSLEDLGNARSDINRMRQQVLRHVLAAPDAKPALATDIAALDATFNKAVAEMATRDVLAPADLQAWLAAVDSYREFRNQTVLPASDRQVTGDELAQVLAECDRRFTPVEQGGLALSSQLVAHTQAQAADAQSRYVEARLVIVAVLVLGLVIATLLGFATTLMIVRPLARVREVIDAVAEGDLTRTADVSSTDEPGQMAAALARATTNVRATVASLASNARSVAGAGEELSANSAEIADAARLASDQTDVANGAVREITASVQSVATGAQEMSVSIREIAQNASEAARVATEAVGAAESANSQIKRLGESSLEIGNVIKVITSIADQTNLLALNATIEAARAGDAGRGFAVVADEVKQLAQETSKATKDIGTRIQAIQADTQSAVTVIGEITAVISRISAYQTTIAGAVEEQTATTNEMSRGVETAAANSERISANMAAVASATATTTAGVHDARQAAQSLAEMGVALQNLVERFRY